jgi:triacylglycerol lipase
MRGALTSAGRAAMSLAREAWRTGHRRPRRASASGGLHELGRCAEPVLLLHGFLSSSRTVVLLERRIRRSGHAALSLDLPSTRRGIEELAARLEAEIEALHARSAGIRPLTVVGHSQGGLVAAWYVKKLGGHRRVRTLITLGTPHNGTPLALAGLPLGPLARSLPEMTPGSALLRRLREGAWPDSVRLVSIYSHQDWVVPARGAMLDASAGPHLRNVQVEGSHFELLTERAIHEVVLRELRGAGGASPRGLGAPEAAGGAPEPIAVAA